MKRDRVPLGRRILVVGDSCSGKSEVGKELARRLRLEPIELDALYWGPGWVGADTDVFRRRVSDAIRGEEWLLIGNYTGQQMDISWPRADTVVWLDFSLRVTLPRLFTRSFQRWRSGEKLWSGNRESFFRQLMLWSPRDSLVAWTVTRHRKRRHLYQAAMQDPAYAHISFHRLRSPPELASWLGMSARQPETDT